MCSKGKGTPPTSSTNCCSSQCRLAGVADFADELRNSGVGLLDFQAGLRAFQQAAELLTQGQIDKARQVLLELARTRPQSSMAVLALAAAQALGHNLAAAEQSLVEPVASNPTMSNWPTSTGVSPNFPE